MLAAVGVAALDRYIDKMSKLMDDYGAKTWHLLYQADVRMRSEHFPNILARLEDDHEDAK